MSLAGEVRREPEETADTTSVATFLVISLSSKLPITFFLVHFYTLALTASLPSGLQLLERGKNTENNQDKNSQAKIAQSHPMEMHHGERSKPQC